MPIVLSFVCLVLLLLILLKLLKKTTKHTFLVIELSNGSLCELIPVMSLSLCPSYWFISTPTHISDVRTQGYFKPFLHISWPNFTITNKLTNQSLVVPNYLPISFLGRKRVQTILNQPYSINILLFHYNIYEVLHLNNALSP